MANKVTRFDQTVDTISWSGLVILWIIAAFFKLILRQDPEAIEFISFIGGKPAAICTIAFLLLTVIIRISPASVPSRIFRYVRFILVVFALVTYGYMCYSYAKLDLP